MHFGLDIIEEINMPGLASNMCLVEDILVRGVYTNERKSKTIVKGIPASIFPGEHSTTNVQPTKYIRL